MRTEDIIEGLNKYIEDTRGSLNLNCKGHLVLQKVTTTNPTFKAYKDYKYTLWFVQASKKQVILQVNKVDKVVNNQDESLIRDINIEICRHLFKLINEQQLLKQLIYGEYKREFDTIKTE